MKLKKGGGRDCLSVSLLKVSPASVWLRKYKAGSLYEAIAQALKSLQGELPRSRGGPLSRDT